MEFRRSRGLAVLLIGAALAAVATPARSAQAENPDVRATTASAPPDTVLTFALSRVPSMAADLSYLALRDSGSVSMAKVLSLASVSRDVLASIDSTATGNRWSGAERQWAINTANVNSMNHSASALHVNRLRPHVEARSRIRPAVVTAIGNRTRYCAGRVIGHDAFPLYL